MPRKSKVNHEPENGQPLELNEAQSQPEAASQAVAPIQPDTASPSGESRADAQAMPAVEAAPISEASDVGAGEAPDAASHEDPEAGEPAISDEPAGEGEPTDLDETGAPVKRRRRRRSRKKKPAAEAGSAESADGPEADGHTDRMDDTPEATEINERSRSGEPGEDDDMNPDESRARADETAEVDAGFAIDPESPFAQMGLSPEVLAAVSAMGFKEPTAIQEQTIPPMMDWRDVIAQAPTGTGKTVAFGIPIIEHFDSELADVQALILAPTRELALQITDELRSLARNRPEIRIATIYGGQRIDTQLEALKHRPQVIVATPGRLIDHLNRRTVSLGTVRTVVLDEADRMLDMGFVRDVRKILDKMPRAWQVTMFSATMSRAVMDISWIYQRDVIELKVVPEAENKPQITQYSIETGAHRRIEVIADLMKKNNYQKAIVFCNRKHVTDYVARRLSALGIRAASIHGDIQQSTREKTLSSFRTGSLRVLVATDVAARGIDVEGVDAVFNYDIPDENEYYVHRIGRTGRARQAGVAYTFTTMMTQPKLDEIMRYTKCDIQPLDVD